MTGLFRWLLRVFSPHVDWTGPLTRDPDPDHEPELRPLLGVPGPPNPMHRRSR